MKKRAILDGDSQIVWKGLTAPNQDLVQDGTEEDKDSHARNFQGRKSNRSRRSNERFHETRLTFGASRIVSR